MSVLELRAKLDQAHELLRRAQGVPEGDRLWLLTLAWAPGARQPGTPCRLGAGVATPSPPSTATDTNELIRAAAKDLEEYQRLTSEGKLGEAGQRLEALKVKLDALNRLHR